ncbi:MAG: SPOR domain-containing protein [Gallionellaceae bacterium]|jgi:DedD protein|nr:SPOR domain-containing protein [Gallionellaceae bacterium]
MAKQISDEEDSLKRRARRRLIGAVALATAVIVLLPMVLDNEPDSSGQGIDLRIPDKDKVDPLVATPPTAASAPASIPVSAPESASPGNGIAASAPAPAVPSSESAVPAAQPVVKPKPSAKPKPPAQPKPAAQPKPPAQSKPPTPSKSPAQASATGKEAFVVQFGAFSSAEAAHKVQQKVIEQGVQAHIEKFGDKLRVRAGPYATREAAEKIKQKLEAKGMQPVVSPAQ